MTPRQAFGPGQAGTGHRPGFCLVIGDEEYRSGARGQVAVRPGEADPGASQEPRQGPWGVPSLGQGPRGKEALCSQPTEPPSAKGLHKGPEV